MTLGYARLVQNDESRLVNEGLSGTDSLRFDCATNASIEPEIHCDGRVLPRQELWQKDL